MFEGSRQDQERHRYHVLMYSDNSYYFFFSLLIPGTLAFHTGESFFEIDGRQVKRWSKFHILPHNDPKVINVFSRRGFRAWVRFFEIFFHSRRRISEFQDLWMELEGLTGKFCGKVVKAVRFTPLERVDGEDNFVSIWWNTPYDPQKEELHRMYYDQNQGERVLPSLQLLITVETYASPPSFKSTNDSLTTTCQFFRDEVEKRNCNYLWQLLFLPSKQWSNFFCYDSHCVELLLISTVTGF